jgi:hypothetical protein
MVLGRDIDNSRFVVGIMFEYAYSTVQAGGDQILAIWRVAEICRARRIYNPVSVQLFMGSAMHIRAGLPRSVVAMIAVYCAANSLHEVKLEGADAYCRELRARKWWR